MTFNSYDVLMLDFVTVLAVLVFISLDNAAENSVNKGKEGYKPKYTGYILLGIYYLIINIIALIN